MSACQHLRCLLHPGQDEDCARAGMHQMMGDADIAYALTELSEDICWSAVWDPRSKAVNVIPRYIHFASWVFPSHPAELSPAQVCLRPEEWALFWYVPFTYLIWHIHICPFHIFLHPTWSKCTDKLHFLPFPRHLVLVTLGEKMLAQSQYSFTYAMLRRKSVPVLQGKYTDAAHCFTWWFPYSGEHHLFQALPTTVTENPLSCRPLGMLPVSC